jgi:hypothetical protein
LCHHGISAGYNNHIPLQRQTCGNKLTYRLESHLNAFMESDGSLTRSQSYAIRPIPKWFDLTKTYSHLGIAEKLFFNGFSLKFQWEYFNFMLAL